MPVVEQAKAKSWLPRGGRRQPCRLKALLLGMGLLAALAASGCTSGAYPVDIFYEMHYQQSYKSHEPPRLGGVENAVAFFPGPVSTMEDIGNSGAYLFEVNCQMCHGAGAKGDGPVLTKLINEYGYQTLITPDLTTLEPEAIEPFLRNTTRPFGPTSVMPPFGKLLSSEERWAIAEYVGTLPK